MAMFVSMGGPPSQAACIAKGESDMPMLSWMGRERAVKQDKEALLKILREDKSMGYLSHAEKRRGGDGVSENLRDSATPRDNNILVHGDNLEALKALLPFCAGEGRPAA